MLQNRLFAITAGSPLISACSSIVDDNHQNIAVDTDPQGARCVLENKQGKFHVPETPGTVMISMSWDDLAVTRRKEGRKTVKTSVLDDHKGIVWGNVIFGGIIGHAVDRHSGAACESPTEIIVMLAES